MSSQFQETIQAIKNAQEIVLCTHVIPDGDGLGSQVALSLALKALDKKVWILNQDNFPKNYHYLEYQSFIRDDVPNEIELAIAIDCSNLKRMGKISKKIKNAKCLIKIDHHIVDEDNNFGHINFVDPSSVASGLLVWNIIKNLDITISPAMATAVYTALLNDTGCFKYSTTAHVLRLGAEILDAGADSETVKKALFQSNPLSSVKMLATILNTIEFFENNKLVIGMVSQSEMIACHALMEDLEGLVEHLLAIEGVEVAIILIEADDSIIRITARSKSNISVAEIVKHFGGGGHKKAAGATIEGRLVDVRKDILEIVAKYI